MTKKFLRLFFTALFTLLAAVIFYIAVIMGEPQDKPVAIQPLADQPLLSATQPLQATEEGSLYALRNAFPAPILQPVSGSGLTFLSGFCEDAAFEKGFGRILTLNYLTSSGIEVSVCSIYPARALPLVAKEDYVLADVAGQALAGLRSVRMESPTHIRLHAQAEEAIYVITVPKISSAELISVTRSLQLFEGE